jgi:P-type Mg2+ transporter
VAGLIVVISPVRELLGFGLLPPLFFVVLALMTLTYLGLVQVLKRRFYEASGWHA